MFNRCDLFKGKGLENWNVSKVENMSSMFYECKNFNCDLSKWNVSNVFDINDMFYDCIKFNCDLSMWECE